MTERVYTAAVLIIGNEILSGRTPDANLAYLGQGLNDAGVRLTEARVIADDIDTIAAAVNELRRTHDYVFTTGGIGPTHDDITAASIAAAFGVAVVRHPAAEKLLRDHYGEDINAARLKMAEVPHGAALIENPVSKAPGFRIGNVHVLAGVPRIMQAQFDAVKHTLAGGAPILAGTVTVYMAESAIATELADLQDKYAGSEIGSYPFARSGRFGTAIVIRSTSRETVDGAVAELRAFLRSLKADLEDDG